MGKWLKGIWFDISEIKSTVKELREFGLVMGGFFSLLAAIAFFRHKNFLPCLSIAGIFFVITYLNVFLLKPLQKLWMGFAVIMGYFMTRLILLVLFFLVLTPLSLLSRIFRKQFLDLEFKKNTPTYWIPRAPEPVLKEHYERQF